MTNNSKIFYIQADKQSDQTYYPTEISEHIQTLVENYEYGDVFENEYQIWEYPSGGIYRVKPDRELSNNDYYATPYGTGDSKWEPVLEQIDNNVGIVSDAYRTLIDH